MFFGRGASDEEMERYYAERDAERAEEERRERDRRDLDKAVATYDPSDGSGPSVDQIRRSNALLGAVGAWIVYAIGFSFAYWVLGVLLIGMLAIGIYGPCPSPACNWWTFGCTPAPCATTDFISRSIRIMAVTYLPAIPISGILLSGGVGTTRVQRWTLFGGGLAALLLFRMVASLSSSTAAVRDYFSVNRLQAQMLVWTVLALIAVLVTLRVHRWVAKARQ